MFRMQDPKIRISGDAARLMQENVTGLISQLSHGKAPQPVAYHYTDGAGLLGIIEHKSLWATHIRCLNDESEYREAGQFFQRAIESAKSNAALNDAQKRILDAALNPIPAVKDENNSGHNEPYVPWFVVSLSLSKDDLSQWRGYSRGSEKFALGFDLNHLARLTTQWTSEQNKEGLFTIQSFLSPVLYQESEKKYLTEKVVEFMCARYPVDEAQFEGDDKAEYAQSWAYHYLVFAIALAPLMKNARFEAEKEWRLIARPLMPSTVKYRMRGGLLTPYMELNLISASYTYEGHLWKHPLRELWIGPSRHSVQNFEAAKPLLEKHEFFPVSINRSLLPYRDI